MFSSSLYPVLVAAIRRDDCSSSSLSISSVYFFFSSILFFSASANFLAYSSFSFAIFCILSWPNISRSLFSSSEYPFTAAIWSLYSFSMAARLRSCSSLMRETDKSAILFLRFSMYCAKSSDALSAE